MLLEQDSSSGSSVFISNIVSYFLFTEQAFLGILGFFLSFFLSFFFFFCLLFSLHAQHPEFAKVSFSRAAINNPKADTRLSSTVCFSSPPHWHSSFSFYQLHAGRRARMQTPLALFESIPPIPQPPLSQFPSQEGGEKHLGVIFYSADKNICIYI